MEEHKAEEKVDDSNAEFKEFFQSENGYLTTALHFDKERKEYP